MTESRRGSIDVCSVSNGLRPVRRPPASVCGTKFETGDPMDRTDPAADVKRVEIFWKVCGELMVAGPRRGRRHLIPHLFHIFSKVSISIFTDPACPLDRPSQV